MTQLSWPRDREPAPFYRDVAEFQGDLECTFVKVSDGVRIRIALMPGGSKGTIVLLPGRTEYVEKYGRVMQDFSDAGYSVATIDWRGQGLSDRPLLPRDVGHVRAFEDYQRDFEALVRLAGDAQLPRPWFLLGHSMGGAIGLRAVLDGLDVNAAAFTGPMWGLQMKPYLKLIAPATLFIAETFGLGHRFALTTGPWARMAFEDNPLTSDAANFEYLSKQVERYPELRLGGPSFIWVKSALDETRYLMDAPPRNLPVITLVGSEEQIVSIAASRERMASWPGGEFVSIEGGRHELMLENSEVRDLTLNRILSHFAANSS